MLIVSVVLQAKSYVIGRPGKNQCARTADIRTEMPFIERIVKEGSPIGRRHKSAASWTGQNQSVREVFNKINSESG